MATSVGAVFLEVVPSLDKFASLLSAGTVSDVKKIGQQAGKDFGDALSTGSKSGLETLKSQLSSAALATEQASVRVATAHNTSATAAEKVQLAESKLAESRQKYSADSSQILAAEQRLSQAKRDAELQSGKTAVAEQGLTDAQDKQAIAAAKLKTAQEEGTVTSASLAKGIGVLGVGTVAVAGALGVIGVKAAADFQTQLTRLVTSAGESAGNLKTVNDGILQIAGTVGTSSSELATGMYTVESAGFHGADGLVVLKAAAQGAKEENANLATVANAVTDILTDYHLPAQQAADVTSKLNETVSLGKTNFESLSGAMSSVAPIAAAAHIPLQDMLGDIAEMTSHGVSAEQATQNLANTIKTLSNPTSIMTQELAQVGIRSDQLSQNLGTTGVSGAVMSISDAIMSHMGPAGTVLLNTFNQSKIASEDANKMLQSMPPNLQNLAREMQAGKLSSNQWTQGLKTIDPIQANLLKQWLTATKHAEGFSKELTSGSTSAQSYTQALAKATGNSTAMNVALMLTGENAASTSSDISKIAEATDEAGGNISGWGEIQNNFNQKLSQAKESLGAFVIQIGEKLLPVATSAIGWVSGFTHGLMDMGTWVKNNINWVGLIATVIGAVVGPILAVQGAMKIWGIVTTALEVANAALNAILAVNPFVLVALAIAGLVAGLVYAYFHFQQFRDIVDAIGNFLKTVFLAVFHAVGIAIDWVVDHWKIFATILAIALLPLTLIVGAIILVVSHARQIGEFFAAAAQVVATAFTWLWNTILKPVFEFIGEAAIILGKIILAIAIAPIVIAVKVLGAIFSWLYANAIKPAFDAIGAVASWLYNNVIKPYFDAIVTAALWLYNNGIKPAFDGIGAAIDWVYKNILLPIWAGLKVEWQLLQDALKFLYEHVIKPIWDAIGNAIDWVYKNILLPIWAGLKVEWKLLQDAFKYLYDNVFKPIWDALGAAISWVYHNVIEPVWNAFKAALETLESAFHSAVGHMGEIWDGLKKAFGTPIEFVIRTILNDGIIKGINWILGQVGISGIPNIPDPNLPTFATGGIVPGYAPGRDTVHALLSPGEGVLIPQATRALGGAQGIDAINALYGGGGHGQPQAGGVPGYSLGGVVGDILGGIGSVASSAWNGLKNVVLGGLRAAASGFFEGVVNPLIGQIPGGPGSVATRMLSGMSSHMETDILNFLGHKDEAAQGPGGSSTPAGSGVAQAAQQYAASHLAGYGWGADQMSPLIALWNQESGWNPGAVNPSSGAYGIPQCYSTDMMILTRRGWLKHDEVHIGDDTIGYNPETGLSEWTRVTAVLHPGIHRVVRYGNSRLSFTTTPNHRWLMRDKRTADEGMREIQDRRARSILILAKEAATGSGLPISDVEAALLGWIAGDGWEEKARPVKGRHPVKGYKSGSRTMTYHIGQTKQENWAAIDAAVDTGGRVSRTRERTVNGEVRLDREWRLTAPYSRDLTERAGNPKTACVEQVLGMSDNQRKAWLDAVFLAEGHLEQGTRSFSQNPGALAEAIKIALYLEGYRPSFYERRDQRYASTSLSIRGVKPTMHVGHPGFFYEDAGETEVWCVTTELGTFTAEQNGHIHLTGNSLGHGHPYDLGDYPAQINWGLAYIKDRYGSPAAAEAHERSNNWYDDGGYLQPGTTHVVNATGRPEPVFSPRQWDLLKQSIAHGRPAGGDHHYHVTTHDPESVVAEIERRQRSQLLTH